MVPVFGCISYVGLRGKRMSQAANNNKRPKNTNSHHHHHHHQSTSSSGAQPSKPSSLGRLSASDAQNDDLDIPTGYVKPAFHCIQATSRIVNTDKQFI
jgi:hypothetical protein